MENLFKVNYLSGPLVLISLTFVYQELKGKKFILFD